METRKITRKRIKTKVKLPEVTKQIRFELTKDLQKSDFNPFARNESIKP